jgi:biotin carboxylase
MNSPQSTTGQRKILWMVTDPRELSIVLTEDVWQSHLAYRPELAAHFDQVRIAVQDPDAIYFDPDSTAAKSPGTTVYWYYKGELLSGKFSGNWVAVVVKVVAANNLRQGYVESAMLPDRILKRLVLEWKK